MELLLLLISVLGVAAIILIAKACLQYRKADTKEEVCSEFEVPSFAGDNVIPFPQKKRGSRVEGISDELWDRWVEVCDMDHSRKRADLLLELMNDTVRHAHGQDRKDD